MKKKYMRLAKLMSKHSAYKHKLGACIVLKNKVLGLGYNKAQTHTKSPSPYKTLHAEVAALINAGRLDLDGAKCYVYREHKDKSMANSKPCKHCESMLKEFGITTVYYTDEQGVTTYAL